MTFPFRIRNLALSLGLMAAGFLSPRAEGPPEGFKVAFLGDQGLGPASEAVLRLVKDEGAHLLVHLGDFDYQGNPPAWEDQTNRVLGPDFPQIALVGNHDVFHWGGENGYGRYVRSRLEKMGVTVLGEAGVQCSFKYRGVFFILTAPGLMGGGHADFIRRQLESDTSIWRISAWHVNQARMQAGYKGDEAGWGVYEESRLGGAIIATAHEHSYSRTHLLSSMIGQSVASREGPLRLRKGRTFAFVSGLGGAEIRPQAAAGNWWASVYTASQGALHGAMFATFHVDGDPRKAAFYFKNVQGAVIDSFEVFSEIDRPILPGITVVPSQPRTLEFDPREMGFPRDGTARLYDAAGRTLMSIRDLGKPFSVSLERPGLMFLRMEGGNRRLMRKIVVLP